MFYLIFLSVLFKLSTAQYWQEYPQTSPTRQPVTVKSTTQLDVTERSRSSTQYKPAQRKQWSNPDNPTTPKSSEPTAEAPIDNYDNTYGGAYLSLLDAPEVIAGKAKNIAADVNLDPNYFAQYQLSDGYLNNNAYIDNSGLTYDNVGGYGITGEGGYYPEMYRRKRAANPGYHHSFQQSFAFPQQSTNRYTGPIALPPGYDKNGAPLPVLDTPEVAAEKSKHLALVARRRAWYQSENNDYDQDGRYFNSDVFNEGNDGGSFSFPHDDESEDDGGHSDIGVVRSHNSWTPTQGPYGGDGEFKYPTGPVAAAGYDGHGDAAAPFSALFTPEVLAERANHFAAYNKIAEGHNQVAKNQQGFFGDY